MYILTNSTKNSNKFFKSSLAWNIQKQLTWRPGNSLRKNKFDRAPKCCFEKAENMAFLREIGIKVISSLCDWPQTKYAEKVFKKVPSQQNIHPYIKCLTKTVCKETTGGRINLKEKKIKIFKIFREKKNKQIHNLENCLDIQMIKL
jgi:hypothetical protein